MKKLIGLIIGFATLSFIACGPSQAELEKQKKAADSAFEKERDNAIDNANNLIAADSSLTKDSVKPEPKKK